MVSITTAPRGLEGEGFPVRRAFAGADPGLLDPFVHMDQMGEVEYAPGEPKGTPWHPHRGFETVTYMIDGTFQHQDSNGGGGLITNGDTQWMTAGAGILHIERPPEALVASGGLFHGFQLWVNLPAAQKWVPPRYQDIRAGNVALLTLLRRWSAAAGHRRRGRRSSRAGRHLHTDRAGPRDRRARARVWCCRGRATSTRWSTCCPAAGQSARSGDRSSPGSSRRSAPATSSPRPPSTHQESRHPNLDLLILGGQPIREPVAHYGPFVMNTHAEIAQALADYQAGRMGAVPADHIGN